MPLRRWLEQARPLPGAPAQTLLRVRREDWLAVAQAVAAAGGRLLALWATPVADGGEAIVRAAFIADASAGVVELGVPPEATYPGLQELFPSAARMQRAAFDLTGVRSTDADERPWLRHAHWRVDLPPLGARAPLETAAPDAYEFVPVAGDGVHEIAVGPVHAGIIEPGHFRFSVVGEKVLKLEERLGYVHKGIERRFTELSILDAHRLAARISGDSAVAFSWAYCQALEGASGAAIPPRAAWLRALYLEIERAANHLGDLGALGNDAGFAFGLSQFSRLKEELLRTSAAAFGARYLFDAVVPGGAAFDLDRAGAAALRGRGVALAAAAASLRGIYDNHSGVRDRFVGAGRVEPPLAARLGLLGLAGRASGQPFDARVDRPTAPYDELAPRKIVHVDGDVAARVAVRFDELAESCRLIAALADGLPGGAIRADVAAPAAGTFAAGLVEGWRGPCFVALEAGEKAKVARCHPHDVSWQNWPVLEHAIVGNIVPDFPLINKSFNLSYSGHDL
jgi:Ni,Fe-hydrogenase III large subunit/Ni,Fe-hydrogenase III component G